MRFGLLALLLNGLLMAQPATLTSLGPAVNTIYPDQSPVLSPDGDFLFFVRAGHPQNIGLDDEADIWMSQRLPDGKWGRALNLGSPVNTRQADVIASCGPAANWLLLFVNGSGQAPQVYARQGRNWSLSESISLPNVTNWQQVAHCFLNAQADLLLLSARLPGGYGGLDLYVAIRQPDGRWSEARNLGPALNTAKDEDRPLLAPDGLTLYYEAERGRRWETLVSRRTRYDGSWENPTTAALPIQHSLVPGQSMAIEAGGEFMITTRADSNGVPGLFRLELPAAYRPRPVCVLRGQCAAGSDRPRVYSQWQDRANPAPLSLAADGRFCTLAPVGQSVLVGARLRGHYAPPVVVGAPAEIADNDPSRGASNLSPEYFQRDANLKSLQGRYATIREDIQRLQTQRDALLERMMAGYTEMGRQKWAPAELGTYRSSFLAQSELPPALAEESLSPLSFDSLVSYTRYALCASEAAEVAAELSRAWLATQTPEDSRPWVQVAEGLRTELSELTAVAAAPAWPGWQASLSQQIATDMGPGIRQILRTLWRVELNALLPASLSKYDKELALGSLEAEMRRLILQQIQEEERKGVAMPELDAPAPAITPDLPPAINQNIPLLPLRRGGRFMLAHTQFRPNTPQLQPEAYLELNHLLLLLQDHPSVRIEIGCHTHGWLGYALSTRLSTQRARAIADYLASKGITRDRLSTQAYGKMIPVASNDTPEGRLLNQRVEITILAAQ